MEILQIDVGIGRKDWKRVLTKSRVADAEDETELEEHMASAARGCLNFEVAIVARMYKVLGYIKQCRSQGWVTTA